MKWNNKVSRLNRLSVYIYHLALAMLALTLCRVGYYLYNYNYFQHLEASELIRAMVGGWLFDAASLGYALSLYGLLSWVGILLPTKYEDSKQYRTIKALSYMLPMFVNIFVNISDAGYYPFVLRRTTMSVFSEFQNDNIVERFAGFVIDYWQLTIYGLLIFALLVWGYFRVFIARVDGSRVSRRALGFLGGVLLTTAFSLFSIRGTFSVKNVPMTELRANDFVDEASDRVLPLNTLFTMIRTIQEEDMPLYHFYPDEELSSVYRPIYSAAPLCEEDTLFGAYRGKNVMVIILESFSREYSSYLNGGEEGYMPFLDSLMQESLVFKYGFANGRVSVQAMPSALSSLPGLGQNLLLSKYAGNRMEGLPVNMSKEGYSTAFYHGAERNSMFFGQFVNQIGVTKHLSMEDYTDSKDYDGNWGIFDHKFLPYVANKIGEQPEPRLSVIFTLSSHDPFTIPDEYKSRFNKYKEGMKNAVEYSDMALEQFFNQISKEEWYDETLFVLMADHASINFRPDYATLGGGYAIPIIFYDPKGRIKGQENSIVAQQVDIYPTLMYLLGNPTPILSYGNNLLDVSAPHFAVDEGNGAFYLLHADFTLQLSPADGKVVLLPADTTIQRGYPVEDTKVINRYEEILKGIVQDFSYRMNNNKLYLEEGIGG